MIKVGQRLQQARLKKGLSIEDVSHQTKIRTSFLNAIEKGEYSKLPSIAYAQGFVRNYVKFLDMPEKEILALFRREFDEEKYIRVLPESVVKDESFVPAKIRAKQSFVIIALIFTAVIGFLVYQFRFALFNPSVYIVSPTENSISYTNRVVVSGKTDPNVTINVDEYPVAVDHNGEFRKAITLFPGKSVITIKAVNTFGKQTIIKRSVEVKQSP